MDVDKLITKLDEDVKNISNLEMKEMESLIESGVLDELFEALQRSLLNVSRETKFKRIVGTFAIQLAKQKNDPLYRKLIRFRRAWKKSNRMLQAKYRGPANMAARKAILSTGKKK